VCGWDIGGAHHFAVTLMVRKRTSRSEFGRQQYWRNLLRAFMSQMRRKWLRRSPWWTQSVLRWWNHAGVHGQHIRSVYRTKWQSMIRKTRPFLVIPVANNILDYFWSFWHSPGIHSGCKQYSRPFLVILAQFRHAETLPVVCEESLRAESLTVLSSFVSVLGCAAGSRGPSLRAATYVAVVGAPR